MDPKSKNKSKDGSNNGYLKVNLSAISFYENSSDNSNYLTKLYNETYNKFFKDNKSNNCSTENSIFCNSSSCYVVFSIKLCTKNKNFGDYWNLCSEVITRPLFVKYKRSKTGFVSFLINHTELLPLKNVDKVSDSDSFCESNPHFDTVLNSNKFLLSFGVSFVKKSTLLYVGYGNKYLSAVELFGKRLSLEISEDKNENKTILNLDKGLLFFDVYVKRSHLVPGTHRIRSVGSKSFQTDSLDEKLKEILSNKGLDIEEVLKDKELVNNLQLEDYTSSSSLIDSVSDLATVKQKPIKKNKKITPPKLGEDANLCLEQTDYSDTFSSVSLENDPSFSESNFSKTSNEKINESNLSFRENVASCSQYDKYLNDVKITYNSDFLQLIDFMSSNKYSTLSQNASELLDFLNIDVYKLKNYENNNTNSKLNNLDYNSVANNNKVRFKLFLKFVNYMDKNNPEEKSIDLVLKNLFTFFDKLFSISNSQGFYDVLWIKMKNVECFENIIKIPIRNCSERMGNLFEYLSKIDLSSVFGIGFLVDLSVDSLSLDVSRSILEMKVNNFNQLNDSIILTNMVFGLDFYNFHPFNHVESNENQNTNIFPAPTNNIIASEHESSTSIHSHEIFNNSTQFDLDKQSTQTLNRCSIESKQSNSDVKWTNLMKNEVNVIRHNNYLQENMLRFIWPSYSKQFA